MNWENVLTNYRITIMEFIFELLVFFALFMIKFKRKKHFVLRVITSVIAISAFGFLATIFYEFFGMNVVGRTLIYTSLFIACLGFAVWCFDESIWSLLFCANLAYAAQNLCYKIFLVTWYFGLDLGIFPDIFYHYDFDVMYHIYYYIFFAIEVTAFYFVFAKKTYKHLEYITPNPIVLFTSLTVLTITVLLCSVQDIHANELSMLLKQTGNFFSIISCGCALLLLSTLLEKYDLKKEVSYLQYMMQKKEEQFAISKDTIDLINIKCHDMRHRVNALRVNNGKVDEDSLKELEEAISIYDSNIKTGNETLDVILTEKSLFCEKNGIQFSCMADGKNLDFINQGDLYCLFGNIIENAIEAVLPLESSDERIINVIVKSKGGILRIETDNYFKGEMQFDNGIPVTTKTDKRFHGFGLKSIKTIVEKYHGKLTLWSEKNIFHLNIFFGTTKKREN